MAEQLKKALEKKRENARVAQANQYELRILRRRQVEQRTGLSRSTLYDRVAAGTFPRPINLGARAVGWLEGEISDWLAGRIEASRKSAS